MGIITVGHIPRWVSAPAHKKRDLRIEYKSKQEHPRGIIAEPQVLHQDGLNSLPWNLTWLNWVDEDDWWGWAWLEIKAFRISEIMVLRALLRIVERLRDIKHQNCSNCHKSMKFCVLIVFTTPLTVVAARSAATYRYGSGLCFHFLLESGSGVAWARHARWGVLKLSNGHSRFSIYVICSWRSNSQMTVFCVSDTDNMTKYDFPLIFFNALLFEWYLPLDSRINVAFTLFLF